MTPSYLNELIIQNYPTRSFRSGVEGLLMVQRVRKSRTGARACSFSFGSEGKHSLPQEWESNFTFLIVNRQSPKDGWREYPGR